MREYITPMVLAAAVGMCINARPVHQIVISTSQPLYRAPAGELYLPAGDRDIEATIETIEVFLEKLERTIPVESDVDARAARFHALVDREFLQLLTQEESRELEILTRWRDDQKSSFYQTVLPKNLCQK